MPPNSYDDAEGMLKDQGLEVVVIPYRPSPPPRSPRSPRSPDKVDGDGGAGARATSNLNLGPLASSPASGESKSCDDDHDGGDDPPPPPPPPKSAAMLSPVVTPRAELAMAEAMGHKVEATPPPNNRQPRGFRGGGGGEAAICDTSKEGGATADAGGAVRARRRSVSVSAYAPNNNSSTSSGGGNKNSNFTRRPTKKKSPPRPQQQHHHRVRSRSSPVKTSGKKGRGGGGRGSSERMGVIQMAKLGYQELCNAIIRPPRSDYSTEILGPEEFAFCGERFVRKDFGVVNERGYLLECSMWKRVHEEDEETPTIDGIVDDVKGGRMNIHGIDDDDGRRKPTTPRQQYRREHGHGSNGIFLNVDDWDENKERGQMYLHVPESFEDESMTSQEGCSDELSEGGGVDDCRASGAARDESRDESPREFSEGGADPDRVFLHQDSETTAHTYYRGGTKTRKRRRDPVVIYLHGNSSSRVEVIPQLGHLLSLGVSVVAFDFAGSGKSEGEFVSLGYFEREDLQTVIHHLRASGDFSTIALWGRSMGAATSIMYGSRDPTISCMILDSSFTDLTRLAEEMVEKGKEQGVNIPNFVVSVALRMIKSSIKAQAGFSIRHLSPISHVNRCFIPALFVAGEHDDFINKRHSERLHQKYAGDKNIVIVDGDHNSPRPRFLLQSACLFLQNCMQLPPSSELIVPLGTNLFAPPWSALSSKTRLEMGSALENARDRAATSTSEDRNWLPINDDNAPGQQQVRRQRSQPPPSSAASGEVKRDETTAPPGLPLDSARTESCTDADSPAGEAFAPPDMSERQKEIQSSLFKMLGQQE